MTVIRPFAAGSYNTLRSTQQILDLKSQLDTLGGQLASGRTADTYAGLGVGRTASLSSHATLSALDGYDATIGGAQTRVKLATTSLTQVISLAGTVTRDLRSGLVGSPTGVVSSGTLAQTSLASAIDALNQSTGETYLFGGREGSQAPVASYDTILTGDPALGQDGLKTLVADQTRADLGSDGQGRLTTSRPDTTTVGLSEDSSAEVRANFGFTLPRAPAATGSALTVSYTPASAATATASFQAAPTEGQRFRVVVNQPDGSQSTIDFTARANPSASDTNTFPIVADPAAAAAALGTLIAPGTLASVQSAAPGDTPPGPGLGLAFAGGSAASLAIGLGSPPKQPAVGDSVTLVLGLHDGTTTTITLTAQATAGSGTGFVIDPTDPAKTVDNLAAALATAVGGAASSTLAASSTVRASSDFFAGSPSPGLAPRRIAFDAAGNASGYSETPQTNTVIWYRGADSGSDPRSTFTARVGSSNTVQLGSQANEGPLQAVLAGLAAVAIGSPTTTDSAAQAKRQALADRAGTLLDAADGTSPSVQEIVSDLSLASNALSNAKSLNASTRSTIQDTVDGIEQVSTEEVATKLLAVQNRLQASYQITSSLSKLSLVNYMG